MSSRTNIDTEEKSVMLAEEQEFYNELIQKLNYYRENILYQLSNGDPPKIKVAKPKDLKKPEKPMKTAKTIKFLVDIPKFIGTDLETYGPYLGEETQDIPNEIADLLIKQQKAEEI